MFSLAGCLFYATMRTLVDLVWLWSIKSQLYSARHASEHSMPSHLYKTCASCCPLFKVYIFWTLSLSSLFSLSSLSSLLVLVCGKWGNAKRWHFACTHRSVRNRYEKYSQQNTLLTICMLFAEKRSFVSVHTSTLWVHFKWEWEYQIEYILPGDRIRRQKRTGSFVRTQTRMHVHTWQMEIIKTNKFDKRINSVSLTDWLTDWLWILYDWQKKFNSIQCCWLCSFFVPLVHSYTETGLVTKT